MFGPTKCLTLTLKTTVCILTMLVSFCHNWDLFLTSTNTFQSPSQRCSCTFFSIQARGLNATLISLSDSSDLLISEKSIFFSVVPFKSHTFFVEVLSTPSYVSSIAQHSLWLLTIKNVGIECFCKPQIMFHISLISRVQKCTMQHGEQCKPIVQFQATKLLCVRVGKKVGKW